MYAEEKTKLLGDVICGPPGCTPCVSGHIADKNARKIEAVLNEQDAEKQVFASVTAANIAAMNGKKETVDTEDISSCDNLSISSTGSAKHPHCLSPAGHLMRRSMHS